jgi:hypothetical protein
MIDHWMCCQHPIHVIEPDQRDQEVIAPGGTILNVQHQCDGPGGPTEIIVSTSYFPQRFTAPYTSIEHRLLLVYLVAVQHLRQWLVLYIIWW